MNLRPPRPEHGALPDCATSRHLFVIAKHSFCSGALPLSQIDTQSICSAECYIPTFTYNRKTFVLLGCATPSHKSILNRFVRQSATSRHLLIIAKHSFCSGALPLSQIDTQSICSAECYIPKFFICFANKL